MTQYTNILSRSGTTALVPEDVSNDMLGRVQTEPDGSSVLKTFRDVPVMAGQTRFPVLASLPVAYFVNGDTGLQQSTEMAWSNKFINIEPLAVYVPVPEDIFDDIADNGFDLWGEISPAVEEAIARTLDDAVYFGVGAPSTWPTNIQAAAIAHGFAYTEGATAANGGIQDDIDAVIGELEIAGFDPTDIIAARTLKGKLRRARSSVGERLSGVNPELTEYLNMSIQYPMRGLFPASGPRTEAFIGDFSEYVVGVRKDIEMKKMDQAVLQDNTGAIKFNLAQQDMVAIRFKLRVGWQVSNRIRYDQPNESSRYPVGVLQTAS